MRPINHSGKRFGKLVAIERVANWPGGFARWRCLCDCGRETLVLGNKLRRGLYKSCGCGRRTHGHTAKAVNRHSPTFKTWESMRTRCSDPRHQNFRHYGGRGIRVCDRWQHSFSAFLEDMGVRPVGYQIDRINNNGNYEPGNCRWVTPRENSNNRRPRQRKAA